MSDNATIGVILAWLWQTTWQTAVLALVIGVTTRAFRRWLSPGARQLLWMLVFVRLVMPSLPASQFSAFHFYPESIEAPTLSMPRASFTAPSLGEDAIPVSLDRLSYAKASSQPWYACLPCWLMIGWMGGALLIVGRMIFVSSRFARMLQRSAWAPGQSALDHVAECCRLSRVSTPAVVVTDLVSTPSLFGVWKPVLLLPRDLRLDGDALRAVVYHELEHLKRRHLLADWVLMVIRAVHWFNPVGWWAHRQIRASRELLCDQAAIAKLGDATCARSYGKTLLEIASGALRMESPMHLAAFAQENNMLRERIETIARFGRTKYIAGLGALLVLILVIVFMTRPKEPQSVSQISRDAQGGGQVHYSDTLKYPDNWPELEKQREQTGARPDEDQALIAQQRRARDWFDKLGRKLPEVQFNNVPFEDVIKNLRDVSTVNILVNWQAIEGAGIKRDAKVTASMRDVEFSKALQTILRDVGGEKVKLGYSLDEGVLTISTADDQADKNKKRLENEAVYAQLDRKVPEVQFNNVPFNDVIEFLRDIGTANIFVNWKTLEAAGIRHDAKVTARMRDVKFSKVLETILRDIGGGIVRLGYTVDEGVLTISTSDDLDSNVITRVYDIRDLIVSIDGTIRIGDMNINSTPPAEPNKRDELVASFIELIQDTVAIDSWKDRGGKIGTIRELSGQLIITQTPDNHRQIQMLVSQLREVRAIQVTIETSFLDLPAQIAAEMERRFPKPPPPTTPNTAMPQRNNGVIFLDDKEVVALRNQAGVATTTAPRMTLFNGQKVQLPAEHKDLIISATASADRKYATINLTIPGGEKSTTLSIPDGGSVLYKLTGANGEPFWMTLRATIIIQREAEAPRIR